jgi:hypothetical protein
MISVWAERPLENWLKASGFEGRFRAGFRYGQPVWRIGIPSNLGLLLAGMLGSYDRRADRFPIHSPIAAARTLEPDLDDAGDQRLFRGATRAISSTMAVATTMMLVIADDQRLVPDADGATRRGQAGWGRTARGASRSCPPLPYPGFAPTPRPRPTDSLRKYCEIHNLSTWITRPSILRRSHAILKRFRGFANEPGALMVAQSNSSEAPCPASDGVRGKRMIIFGLRPVI